MQQPQLEHSDRRITDVILEYWNELRGSRPFPGEEDVNPSKIATIWDSCFLIQVFDIEKGRDYNYTYLGHNIVDAYGEDLTDASVKSLVSMQADHLADVYEQVIVSKNHVVDEGEFENAQGKIIKYRQCLVPLGNNGKVASILGGMRYKVFK